MTEELKVEELKTEELKVEDLNDIVNTAHYAHYTENFSGLVDTSKNASPNSNQIHHLYSTGRITHQKGAWAYLQRSEFTIKHELVGAKKYALKFPLKSENDETSTYAILTREECDVFRKQMEQFMENSKYRMNV